MGVKKHMATPLGAIRKDESGVSASVKTVLGGLVGVLVLILLFGALIDPIQDAIYGAKLNTTSTAGDALLDVVPLLVIIGVVTTLIAIVIVRAKF